MSDSPLELDHLFVWVSEGAPEASALERLGLRPDPTVHKHAGQGTSSVVFLFERAYLELIWVDEPEVAAAKGREMGADMIARADWRRTGASPFGVGLRRRRAGDEPPFPTREYRAEWMPPETCILIAEDAADVREPFRFVVPEGIAMAPPEQLEEWLESKPEMRESFTHPLGVRALTGARVGVGGPPYAELTFDDGARGELFDAGPTLPLRLRY
jgi:hypothetical protein